ncbi:hypothetical protein MalM25_37570 [Planctomycetes bacterium MalM25]|nr:hypothetical protein MalM25_37570 [Planctomycetes bacterium MalM25]
MRGNRLIEDAPPPRGMTLIELLVVIVLLTTLVTTAIPIISPAGEGRKIREASRSVNAYLQGAQARAIQTGRPYGVAFRRLSADTDKPEDNAVCAQLRYVEVPPAYSGVDSGSMARLCVCEANGIRHLGLQLVHLDSDGAPNGAGLPPGYEFDLLPDGFLRPYDQVVLGGANGFTVVLLENVEGQVTYDTLPVYPGASPYAGYFNTAVTGGGAASTKIFRVRLLNDSSEAAQTPQPLRMTHNWNGAEIAGPESIQNADLPQWDNSTTPRFTANYLATAPAPYKIYRQPTLAGGEPLELPAGVAIDLQGSVFASGKRVYPPEYDYNGSAFRLRNDDFMVLFSPEGHIHRVHNLHSRNSPSDPVVTDVPQPVSGSLALLIGRRELIPATPQGVTGTPTYENYAEPVPINVADYNELPETEAAEVTDQYNWLNLESQWVVIGGTSGSVTSIGNSAVYPSEADTNGDGTVTLGEQLGAALENAPRRSVSGGR